MQKQLRTTTHAASMQKTQTNMNRWFILAIVLLLSLIGAKAGFGQTTIHGRWNFDPNNNADVNRSLGSEVSLGPGPVAAGTVAVFFPGTGISTTAPSGQVTRATGTGAITASAAAGSLAATGWGTTVTTPAAALAGNKYFQFGITNTSGGPVAINQVVVAIQRSSALGSPTNFTLYSSADAYAAPLVTVATAATVVTQYVFNFTTINLANTANLTFRLAGYGGNSNTATARIGTYGAVDIAASGSANTGSEILISNALAAAPTVTTPTQASITTNSATLGAHVTSDGGVAITERGIIYSATLATPTLTDVPANATKVITAGTTGVFTVGTGAVLSPSTNYKYRGYATNAQGTGYSSVDNFNTVGPIITTTPTTLALSYFVAPASDISEEQTFSVSGTSLTANIIITPPAGYEISFTSGTGFTTSFLTVGQSGGTAAIQSIFIRLAANPVGNYSGTLQIVSGAVNKNTSVAGFSAKAKGAFTPGNLVVVRVGAPGNPSALTGVAAPLFMVEYNTAGTEVDNGMVPVKVNGGNFRVTVPGSSSSTGFPNLSPDRKYLVLSGANAPIGDLINSFDRTVGRVDYTGATNSSTIVTGSYVGNNMRSATTVNGNTFWLAGTSFPSGTAGIRTTTLGATSATSVASGTDNMRNVQISDGQLYASSSSGAATGINKVGTGTPTASGQSLTNILTTSNIYSFAFEDLSTSITGSDVIYAANDGNGSAIPGGIYKYRKTSSGPWTLGNTSALAGGSITGGIVFGIYAEKNGADVNVYFTTTSGLYKYVDVNANSSVLSGATLLTASTLLAAAPANTSFRGIVLSPENVQTPTITVALSAPGAATVAQGAADKVIYQAQLDVTVANTILTGVNVTTAGNYQAGDVQTFHLYISPDATFNGNATELATIAGGAAGQTLAFSAAQGITQGTTRYLYITADVTACNNVGRTIAIVSTDQTSLTYAATANVNAATYTQLNYTITTGQTSNVSSLTGPGGAPNVTLGWTNPTCATNILVVAHTASIAGTPSGSYTGNANYAVAPAFPGGGKVVYYGPSTSVIVSGLTPNVQYYFKVFAVSTAPYSPGVEITATPQLITLYSRASGNATTGSIWALTPGGTAATAASLGGFTANRIVVIQTNHVVDMATSGAITALNLTVQSGATLTTSSAGNAYLNLNGNVINSGTIGGTSAPDNNFSLNINGATVSLGGNGVYGLNRIRTNGVQTAYALSINANIDLYFAPGAALYSNVNGAFNVTVEGGKRLRVLDAAGDVSLDGEDGANAGNRGGTLTVNGTLEVGRSLLLQNNNVAGLPTALVIGSAGRVTTTNFTYDGSGGSGQSLTISAGGKLQIKNNLSVVTGTISTNGVEFVTNPATGITGRLLTLAGASNVTGVVTVERQVNSAGWHFFAAPVQGATTAQWSELAPVFSPLNNASIFKYTENDTTSQMVNGTRVERYGWKVPTNGEAINTANNQKGYRIYVRSAFVGSKVSVTGQPFTGNVSQTISYTPLTRTIGGGVFSALNDGYNLIGNPYASEINWDLVVADVANTVANLDGSINIFNPASGGGVYGSYVGGTPTNGVTKFIASSQGFMVRAQGAPTGPLTFKETYKVANATNTFVRQGADDVTNRIYLRIISAGQQMDETAIWFRTGATRGFDRNMDAIKMTNPVFNISSTPVAAMNLVINSMPELTAEQTLPLSVGGPAGTYTLRVAEVNTLLAGAQIWLKDNFLGTLTDVTAGANVAFTINSNPASTGNGRFELVANGGVTGNKVTFTGARMVIAPNPATAQTANVALTGLAGQTKATVRVISLDGKQAATSTVNVDANGNTVVRFTNLNKGVYVVKAQAGTFATTSKLIIE